MDARHYVLLEEEHGLYKVVKVDFVPFSTSTIALRNAIIESLPRSGDITLFKVRLELNTSFFVPE